MHSRVWTFCMSSHPAHWVVLNSWKTFIVLQLLNTKGKHGDMTQHHQEKHDGKHFHAEFFAKYEIIFKISLIIYVWALDVFVPV